MQSLESQVERQTKLAGRAQAEADRSRAEGERRAREGEAKGAAAEAEAQLARESAADAAKAAKKVQLGLERDITVSVCLISRRESATNGGTLWPRSSDDDHPFLLQDLRCKLDAVPVEVAGLCSAHSAQVDLISGLVSVTDETRHILVDAAASSEAQMDGLRADMLAVQVGVMVNVPAGVPVTHITC